MSYPINAYHQASACGATPVGQVVALYDTILRDFHRAGAALAAKDVEVRVFEMNHALLVLAELENVLDFEKGGEAAKHLKSFYEVSRALMLEVSVSPAQTGFQRLIDIFTPVRQAWAQVERQLPVVAARQAAPAIRVPMLVGVLVPGGEADNAEKGQGMTWKG